MGEQPISSRRIAVIIVNFNGGKHILRCLDALSRQSIAPHQTIVVDNNSIDGSPDQIESTYPDIRLLKQKVNLGFAAANNLALNYVESCEWVALLNPDTIPYASWLEQLLSAVALHPDTDIFSSKLLAAENTQVLDGTGDVYHVSGLSWRRHHGRREGSVMDSDPVFSPCAAAALYRLSKFNQTGGFDERYFCYHEDVDLAFRMRLIGSNCIYVKDSVVEHVGSGITGQDSDFSVYHGHRNLVWTYFKNMPGTLFWKYLPQHLLLNTISVLYYVAKGRGGIILKAKWHAIKGLPSVLRQRRVVQSTRNASLLSIEENMATGWLKPYLYRHR